MDAAIIISVVALVVAILVGVSQLVLQRRMAMIESDRRYEEITSKRMAEVTARIESYERYRSMQAKAYRFILENVGPARAEDVSFEIQAPAQGEAPMPQMEGHTFPISLDVGVPYKMGCIVVMGTAPAVDVDLAWKDGTGPRTKTMSVTVY